MFFAEVARPERITDLWENQPALCNREGRSTTATHVQLLAQKADGVARPLKSLQWKECRPEVVAVIGFSTYRDLKDTSDISHIFDQGRKAGPLPTVKMRLR